MQSSHKPVSLRIPRIYPGECQTIRFTPRKPRSNWSAVNIRRVEELSALARMRPAGLAAFERRADARSRVYSFERRDASLPSDEEAAFRSNVAAWDFFQTQPPSYRKAAIWWVISAKKEGTRRKRLAALIAHSAQRRRIAALTSPSRRTV
jgi:uncharacterized protein YdeI (YjbR/CyaY-like superfamily)